MEDLEGYLFVGVVYVVGFAWENLPAILTGVLAFWLGRVL